MTKHVIELNGQQYDALTGKPVVASVTKATPAHKTTQKALKKSGPQHLDGFSRRPGAVSRPPAVTHKIHAQPEKSKTLMRSAVKRPVTHKIHATTTVQTAVAPKPITQKPLLDTFKPGRIIRASNIAQSNLISKFGKTEPEIKTAVVPVKAPPKHHVQPTVAHTTAPVIQNHPAQTVAKVDPFQSAIDNAVSHEQPRTKKTKAHHRLAKKLHVSPRLVSFVGITFIALSIGGFLAQQNLPQIAMRVASTRAGLNANLPSYQPAGFSMAGPIKYQPGEVTLNYKSNSDNRSFNVTQKNSSWNSETLLENYVAANKQPYQTFQANGRTIYIYEGNKATWVDGGVWFNIDGKANLNSDQLLRIAASL